VSSSSNNNSSTVSQKPAVAADQSTLTPEQVIEALRALRGQIPEFVLLPNDRAWQQLRRNARIDVVLVHEGVNAVGAADLVRSFVGATPEELRQAEDEDIRWAVAEGEIRTFLRGVVAANLIRRQRIGKAVKAAYRLSRTLVQKEEFAHLLPHVETMFRIVNRKPRPAKPAPPPDEAVKK